MGIKIGTVALAMTVPLTNIFSNWSASRATYILFKFYFSIIHNVSMDMFCMEIQILLGASIEARPRKEGQ